MPRPKNASKDIVSGDPKDPVKGILPGGSGQSFGPSPASASASASARQERSAPLWRRDRHDPVQVEPRDNFRVISALVQDVQRERNWAYEGSETDMKEEIKTRLARAGIEYDSGVISRALDSEEFKAKRRR